MQGALIWRVSCVGAVSISRRPGLQMLLLVQVGRLRLRKLAMAVPQGCTQGENCVQPFPETVPLVSNHAFRMRLTSSCLVFLRCHTYHVPTVIAVNGTANAK